MWNDAALCGLFNGKEHPSELKASWFPPAKSGKSVFSMLCLKIQLTN
jgi:hypothetical protein